MKKVLIAVIVIIAILAVAVLLAVRFNLFGCKTMNWNNSFCVDRLPDFPENIGEFSLYEYSKRNWRSEYDDLNGETFCSKSIRVVYYNEKTQEAIHLMPAYLTEGEKSSIIDYIMKNLSAEEIRKNVFRLAEQRELFWSTDTEFDYMTTQTYLYEPKLDGSISNKSQVAEIDNEVIQYFLDKYPPVAE